MKRLDQVVGNVDHGKVDGESGAHVEEAHLVELRLPEPVAPDHGPRLLLLDQVGTGGAAAAVGRIGRGRGAQRAGRRPLPHTNVEDGGEDKADAENEKGDLLKGDGVPAGDRVAAAVVHAQCDEHEDEYGDVGKDGAGVAPGVQLHALRGHRRQVGNERQVGDLHGRPAKLEDSVVVVGERMTS